MKIHRGFTLLEMMLVLVIIGSITVMVLGVIQERTRNLRLDKASLQVQQILNAGLAFYVANDRWPKTLDEMKTQGYLPQKDIYNLWEQKFGVGLLGENFAVWTNVLVASNASILASRLPFGQVVKVATSDPGTTIPPVDPTGTGVMASINIPGQNLNNATAVNFAAVYHQGACVPAPACPVNGNNMKPQIFVAPVKVSGGSTQAFPITSFTSYAVGNASGDPVLPSPGPMGCDGNAAVPCDLTGGGASSKNQKFWRVCLNVQSSNGPVKATDYDQANAKGLIMAVTRCASSKEKGGSGFKVFTQG